VDVQYVDHRCHSVLLLIVASDYWNSHWTNGYTDELTGYKGIHTTDVTQTKALAMLDDAAKSKDQFFMMVAPGKSALFPERVYQRLTLCSCSTPARRRTY
jgi:hypothetical protein